MSLVFLILISLILGESVSLLIKKIANAADGLTNIYDIFTGSLEEQALIIEKETDDGYPDTPPCDNWVISSLEERNNIILTNINNKYN